MSPPKRGSRTLLDTCVYIQHPKKISVYAVSFASYPSERKRGMLPKQTVATLEQHHNNYECISDCRHLSRTNLQPHQVEAATTNAPLACPATRDAKTSAGLSNRTVAKDASSTQHSRPPRMGPASQNAYRPTRHQQTHMVSQGVLENPTARPRGVPPAWTDLQDIQEKQAL